MNGLEFARCTTAGGHTRALIHAAPALLGIEVCTDSGDVLAKGDVDREGAYSPMTLIELDGAGLRRSEVWPTEELYGVPVLLAGGEVGVLRAWEHGADHSWWRWTIEFSNHVGRPPDWHPELETAATG